MCSTARRSGLAVRTVGENPAAVEAQGIDVTWLRIGAVAVGSAFMALGGAFLTMSAFNSFYFDMVNGRGWICIALVVFGSWRPGKALLGAHPVRGLRRLSAAPAAAGRRLCALSGVPDAALYSVDPGADRHVAPRRLSAGADDRLSQGRALNEPMLDLILRGANLPDGRTGHRYRHPGRQDRRGRAGAEGRARAQEIDATGPPGHAAFRRRAFPHGRDPVARPAAAQPVRHAARRHRAVGRAEAAADAGGDRRAGAGLLRLGGGARAAGDPQPCRHLRPAPAGGRCAARGEEEGRSPISICSWSPSRRTACSARRARWNC